MVYLGLQEMELKYSYIPQHAILSDSCLSYSSLVSCIKFQFSGASFFAVEAKAEVCSDRKYPCSIFASCDITRPQMCQCTNGYEGDGYYCQEIDKCLKDNGGCSKNAVCRYVGPVRQR